ncbi:hypothetical protein DsansV1_C24g0181481 [Dioscorea sansibarensis]
MADAGQASKWKKKVAVGTQGSVNIIRGARHGGVIVGRKNPHAASFITARELNVLVILIFSLNYNSINL